MKLKLKITLIDHFSKLTDPRIERTKEHKLIDIVTDVSQSSFSRKDCQDWRGKQKVRNAPTGKHPNAFG
jgi:hypothetical protein